MKKIILVFAAIAFSAGVYAQTDSAYRHMNQRNMHQNQNQHRQTNPLDKIHPDGVMMQNGKIMKVENGQLTLLDREMTLSNGTRIMSDGTFIKTDGTRLMLKEGQHIDKEGNLTFIKKDEDKDMYLVPDSTRKEF